LGNTYFEATILLSVTIIIIQFAPLSFIASSSVLSVRELLVLGLASIAILGCCAVSHLFPTYTYRNDTVSCV